ncbi:MAG: calcium-translocating P-type ATPase, PMCA-type [Kiritimatiellaeota bacterium]|nr:calcium-translocating P-type ATPase, PMCA-type [Kiritimatiellota bacterium]
MRGLTREQVLASRQEHGANVLTPPPRNPWWKDFLRCLEEPIIRILLVALVLSVGVSCYPFFAGRAGMSVFLEPTGILLAVLLATVVGFLFERSANKKFEVLNKVNDGELVKAVRDGAACRIRKCDVVVGDIVKIETGDELPADGELVEAVALQVDESSLTGEPTCDKTANPADFKQDAAYASNQVLRGTKVLTGHGTVEITRVGDRTEAGKVFKGVQIDSSVVTPLNEQLGKLAGLITKASYVLAGLIITGRMCWWLLGVQEGAFDWAAFVGFALNTVMIAVTLIVVTVPEGLPMSVTLSLALSMKRMLSANNLVRKMHACETMGATTVICTDKTGTLTQNRMKIAGTAFYAGGPQEDVARLTHESFAVNTTADLNLANPGSPEPLGNPTEAALLFWLHDKGVNYLDIRDKAKVIAQLPFSAQNKYMATVAESPAFGGRRVLHVKGAPEIVLGMCGTAPATQADVEARLAAYQGRAMRTLGFAFRFLDAGDSSVTDGKLTLRDLTFLGIAAISDPVRADVPMAIRECVAAGIAVKIVTGDTPGTAKEVGRQIGLWDTDEPEDNLITGADFAALSEEAALARLGALKIIARARPMDKQRLVELLQKKGQVVAVTGDGTNDAPALNAAQVGLSMGDGTSVAKEASDITILDNSFVSITRAVMWGRSLYQNIQRFILFQMTVNVTAGLTVLIGAFIGMESPLTVTQMLWVNLIMDTFAALALASLPPNEAVMRDTPRDRGANIITGPMARRVIGAGVFFVLLLFGLMQYFKHADITSLAQFSLSDFARSYFNFGKGNGLSAYELSLFFTIFVLLQFWNMFNAKAFMTGRTAFADLGKSGGFMVIATVILLGQWVIVTVGGAMFNVTPLAALDWGIILSATSLVLLVGEIARAFFGRGTGNGKHDIHN